MQTITLTDRVASEIQQRISSGQFPVGSQLPPGKVLAAEFGVSSAVVREAIARIQSHGMIESRQGSRTLVTSRTPDQGFSIPAYGKQEAEDLTDVYELRLDLEVAAVSRAALRRTSDDIKALKACLEKMRRAKNGDSSGVEADVAFHLAIASATGNKHYFNLVQYLNLNLRKSIAIARENSARYLELPEVVQQEHECIFEAILNKDQEAAANAMVSHINGAIKRLALVVRTR